MNRDAASKLPGGSRIGKRIIASFMLLALLPLLAFAWLSHDRVRSELQSSSRGALRQDLKAVGVTILERIRAAAAELALEREHGRIDRDRKTTIEVAGSMIETPVPAESSGLLDQGLRDDLERLEIVLRSRSGPTGGEVWLFAKGAEVDRDILAARLSPDFLFRPEGLSRPPAAISIHQSDGSMIRAIDGEAPTTSTMLAAGLGSESHGDLRWGDGDEERVGSFWEVFMEPQFGRNVVVAIHEREAAMTAPLRSYRRDLASVVLVAILVVLLASLVRIRGIMQPVIRLVEATERIGGSDLSVRVPVAGNDEFSTLAGAFNDMAESLDYRSKLMSSVNEFGASLGAEVEPRVLIKKLMRGVAMMFKVDGVLVHTMGDGGRLELDHLRIRSLDISLDRERNGSCALYGLDPDELTESPMRIVDLGRSDDQIARLIQAFTATSDFCLRDGVVLPMRDHNGEPIGVLTLFNAENAEGSARAIDGETVDLAASLAAQASVAITNVRLRSEFKALFDAMIEVLAVAVDEKSPYTGGHCRRVPKIAMMLFEEVQKTRNGPFAEVSFDQDEVYEMQVAALLHDCGKVVTPVHVVDKATKLETIWDRIHLIDQRFELVERQREVAELRARAKAADLDLESVDAKVADWRAQIESDRDFLRRANIGGEFMRDEDIARIEEISARWQLAAGEHEPQAFLSEDEHMNLAIRKGTLNDEERRIINYHMDATIMMLEQLPFPKRLSNVAAIAGSHHERMDGKGFPRGLDASTIPLQGRMLAIADVFEALTAIDRPYKKGMGFAQSLKIMAFMARDGHLDPELYRVFVTTRVWERYGNEVLTAEQRDEVDVEAMLELVNPQPSPAR